MISKVVIRDNKKSPVSYLSDLDVFKNDAEFDFINGVNIIVGENGSGKTTLMKLIEAYLMVDYDECGKGMYASNINKLYRGSLSDKNLLDGVDVYADYDKNVFRLSHAGEKERREAIETFEQFGAMAMQHSSSTGEGVIVAINSMLNRMFGKNANLKFDYSQFKADREEYFNYVESHRVDTDNSWTILMDEPDRNLSICNIGNIMPFFEYKKEETQVIATIHNPLIIYKLSKDKSINFIELTDGYVDKVVEEVDYIVKGKRK